MKTDLLDELALKLGCSYLSDLKCAQNLQKIQDVYKRQDYVNRGLGFVAWHDGIIVAGASSYTVYQGGIEIEIVTHEDYRRCV